MGSRASQGWHGECCPSADVELRPVSGTGDLVIDEFTLHQRAAVVRADIVDRIELAVDAKESDQVTIHLDQRLARISQFGSFCHPHKICHLHVFLQLRRAVENRFKTIGGSDC